MSEDIRAGRKPPTQTTPSFRFILIEGDQPDQAAQQLVASLQSQINIAIAAYNSKPGRSAIGDLSLADVRKCFLGPALTTEKRTWRSLATAFITYFLEWDYRGVQIDLRPASGTAEPFFLHLFRGCVLFESLLKANPKKAPKQPTLGGILDELATDLAIPNKLGTGGGVTFPIVLSEIAGANDHIATAVRFAGRIRNTTGHDLGWDANFNRTEYDFLASMTASACLHAIACLYR